MNLQAAPSFFIPGAKDREQADKVWNSIRLHVATTLGWQPTERRIYSVEYKHDGSPCSATVGKMEPHVQETVIAILEAPSCWLVCTPNRGVVRDMPILIGIPTIATDFAGN